MAPEVIKMAFTFEEEKKIQKIKQDNKIAYANLQHKLEMIRLKEIAKLAKLGLKSLGEVR